MASKKNTAPGLVPALTPAVVSDITGTVADDGAPDELDTLLSELAGGAESYSLSIFRRQLSGPETGRLAYVARVPLAGFSLEDLQREYGGGRYVLKVHDTETGRYLRSRTVTIEGAPASASPSSHPDVERVERKVDALIESLSRQGATQQPQSSDVFGMVRDVFSLVTTMMPPRTEAPAASGATAKELFDTYFRGREDGLKEASRTGGSDVKDALVSIGAPLLSLARENLDMQRRNGANGTPADAAPPQSAEVADMSPKWALLVRPFVGGLFERARAGKNARVYANTLVEDLSDSQLELVAGPLASSDFVEQFCAAFPQFSQTPELRQWVADFVDEARTLLDLHGGDVAGDDTPNGEAAHVG